MPHRMGPLSHVGVCDDPIPPPASMIVADSDVGVDSWLRVHPDHAWTPKHRLQANWYVHVHHIHS